MSETNGSAERKRRTVLSLTENLAVCNWLSIPETWERIEREKPTKDQIAEWCKRATKIVASPHAIGNCASAIGKELPRPKRSSRQLRTRQLARVVRALCINIQSQLQRQFLAESDMKLLEEICGSPSSKDNSPKNTLPGMSPQ